MVDEPHPSISIAAVAEQYQLKRIVQEPDSTVDESAIVLGICSAYAAKPCHIGFIDDEKSIPRVDFDNLDFLIIPEAADNSIVNQLERSGTLIYSHSSPRLAIAKIASLFDRARPWQQTILPNDAKQKPEQNFFCSPSAVIADNVQIGEGAYIGPNVTIEHSVVIGKNSIIQGNNYIGNSVKIGNDCWIHPGAIIGSEGFGLVPGDDPTSRVWQRVPHLGTVIIGDRVEVGANTTIDRGAIDNTVLADDVILDNLIQIAHNVQLGRGTAMAGCAGVAGSTTIGSGCLIGGGSCISGHLTIGDNTMVNGMSAVFRNLPSGGHFASAFPVLPAKQWNKLVATMRRMMKKKG